MSDVCDATTSWPVAFDLVPVGVGNYPFAEPHHVWAEPRLPAAVEALRDVHARPEERAARTANARRRIAEHNDPAAAAARIGAILATLEGGPLQPHALEVADRVAGEGL